MVQIGGVLYNILIELVSLWNW